MKVSRLRIAIIMIASMMFLFTNTSVWGQQDAGPMQKGYVKTKGRMVDGKHVKGNGLKGAVVVLQGRTDIGVQNNDGSFSFPIVGKKYTVQSVKKNGYQLVDADAAPKTYAYASNPIYLVMETPEQRTQDLLDSERKIRRTLQKQLQKREEELESLKETHKINLEEYQNAMQKLYADEKNNEGLISKMAKEYAQMDYDQMSGLKQRIYDAISNGRLAEADSLMLTKGDMISRMEEIMRKQQIENDREKEIEQETRELNEAKGGTQKEKDEIAEDCKILCNRFMLELEVDSAAYYVELLANFDSTNVCYLARAGKFFHDICSYEKAESYYLNALSNCRQSFEEYVYEICALQQNLAEIYKAYKEYSKAEELIKDNIEILKRFGGKIHSRSDEEAVFDECTSLLGLGGLYVSTKQYADAESLYLDLLEKLYIGHFGYEDEYNQSMIAGVLWMLGISYYYDKKYERSDGSFVEAVKILRNLASNDPSRYKELGGNLSFWAMFKLGQEDFKQSELLFLEALEAYSKSISENKDFDKAQVYWGLASVYRHMKRTEDSERYFKEALIVYKRYAQAIPRSYNNSLSRLIKEFALLYKEIGRIEESKSLLLEDLEIDLWLVKMNPNEYNPQLAFLYNAIGELKEMKKEYQEAIPFFEKALGMRRLLMQEDSTKYTAEAIETMTHLADLYTTIADSCYNSQHVIDSEKWYLKAIEIQKLLAAEVPEISEPIMASTIEHLAIIYWNLQRYQEAETMYDMLLELERKLSHLNSDYNRYYINLLYKLSQLYPNISNYKASYKIYKEWLPILKQQYVDNPTLMYKDYAECLGRQSFYAILNRQFAEAEQLAREGLRVDPTLHWISGNIAPALLFQGKYSQAKEIYLQYKTELKEDFQKDFELFVQFDVIPNERKKEFEKIKDLINK